MSKSKQLLLRAKLEGSYWGRKIRQAEEVGGFTDDDKDESGNWTTCACGKQSEFIPRHPLSAEPYDDRLSRLGDIFSEKVYEDNFAAAAKTLIAIEDRAAIVLFRLSKHE